MEPYRIWSDAGGNYIIDLDSEKRVLIISMTIDLTIDQTEIKTFFDFYGKKMLTPNSDIIRWEIETIRQDFRDLIKTLQESFQEPTLQKKIDQVLDRQNDPNSGSLNSAGLNKNLVASFNKLAVEEKKSPLLFQHEEGNIKLYEYTEKSYALFTEAQYGRERSSHFRNGGGIFNASLKDPISGQRSAGWIFAKSSTKSQSFLKEWLGVELETPPAKEIMLPDDGKTIHLKRSTVTGLEMFKNLVNKMTLEADDNQLQSQIVTDGPLKMLFVYGNSKEIDDFLESEKLNRTISLKIEKLEAVMAVYPST